MFITFEGGEGAGKSTVIAAAAAALRARGVTVLTTREPGAGELGEAIRSLLLDQAGMPPESENAELLASAV